MAKFSDVYKQELKSKGVLSSIGSAALKRTREKLDVRNMLFGGSGAIAATGQKIFGKGYQAIQKDTSKKLSDGTGVQSVAMDQLLVSAQRQETQLSIIAKNTMNSNAMARDINVMRQNIMKLVTMGGGKASRGADMFFKESAARETAYESQFKKDTVVKETTPTVEKSKSGGLLGMLAGMAAAIVGTIKSTLGGIPELLKNIFSVGNIMKMFGIAGNVISGFAKLLPMLVSPAFLGIIAAVAGAAWLMKWIESKNDEANTEEKTDLRKAQDRGSQSSKLAARTMLVNDDLKSLLADDRTDQDVSDYTRGEIKTKQELATAITSAESAGQKAITIKDSQVQSDAQQKLSQRAQESMQDGSYDTVEAKRFGIKPESTSPTSMSMEPAAPTKQPSVYNAAMDSQAASVSSTSMKAESTSPTSVSTNSDGAFKNKNDFIKAMYPLAVKAAEALGGIDPNALLTQWGFESAWGQKVSGRHNYFGIKADKSWTGDKKDVMTHEFIDGKKIKIPQPFRSYGSPEEAVNDYVKFLKNNKRYTKAGVFKSKTSSEFFSALQSAGYATDPNYATKLTAATASTATKTASLMPPTPSSGSTLQQGSSTLAAAMRESTVTQAPNVVVNAPPAPQVSSMGGGSVTMASVMDDEFARRVLNYVGA
jgi:flagellar rod assembly protein/muramidase FlgJ